MISPKLTIWKQPSSISERRPASIAMAVSLHNHCLCRVGAWSRTTHGRSTPDVRNLTGMQELRSFSSGLSLIGCFLTNRSKDQPETAPDCGSISRIEGQLQSWSSTALPCRLRLFARDSSKYCDLLASNLIICLAWPHESWIFFFGETLSDVVAICTL